MQKITAKIKGVNNIGEEKVIEFSAVVDDETADEIMNDPQKLIKFYEDHVRGKKQ